MQFAGGYCRKPYHPEPSAVLQTSPYDPRPSAASHGTRCNIDPTDVRTAEIEQAQHVLRSTHDGDDLAQSDLALLQAVVNYGRTALQERSRLRWDLVVEQVARGQYVQPWLHGVEHLTKDQAGYVLWRGTGVEHFSFCENEAAERAAAERLGQCCRFLEGAGRQVSSAQVMRAFDEARYGQGMELDRWLVMWITLKNVSRIAIEPIDSGEESLSDAEIGLILDRQMTAWRCSREELRHMRVVCREDFDSAAQQLAQSCDWAMRALNWYEYSSGRRGVYFLERLHAGIDREQLPTAAALSEGYFCGAGGSPTSRERRREAPQ